MILIASGIGWVICGIITTEFYNSDFRTSFPILYETDYDAQKLRYQSFAFGLFFGPFGLVAAICMALLRLGWTLRGDVVK